MNNPRENYIYYLFGETSSSTTNFAIKMGMRLPDVIMKDMIISCIEEMLKATGKPPLTEEEKNYYDKITAWAIVDSKKLTPIVDKILMERKNKFN